MRKCKTVQFGWVTGVTSGL